MNLIGTILVYAALAAMLFGGVSLIRPLKFLGIASRPHGIVVLLCGVVVFLIGVNLPAAEKKIAARTTILDDFVPAYQFAEFHSIRVKAPRAHVYQAIREVPANEITLFRTLIWIRRFGRRGSEGILNAPEKMPLLEVATRTSFMLLAEEPDREIVLERWWVPRRVAAEERPDAGRFQSAARAGLCAGGHQFSSRGHNQRGNTVDDGDAHLCHRRFGAKKFCGVLASDLSGERADSRDVAPGNSA